MAATHIVNAPQVCGVYLESRQVVVQCNSVTILLRYIVRLLSGDDTLSLNHVALADPKLGVFENIRRFAGLLGRN